MQHSDWKTGNYVVTDVNDNVLPEFGSFDHKHEAELFVIQMNPDSTSEYVLTNFNVVRQNEEVGN